jgi:hypothetical protein
MVSILASYPTAPSSDLSPDNGYHDERFLKLLQTNSGQFLKLDHDLFLPISLFAIVLSLDPI